MVSKWPIWDTFVTERNLLDGSRVTHVKWAVTKRHQRDQLLYSSAMVAHARRRPNVRRSLCWISWTLIQVNWHRGNPNHFFTETVMVFEIRSADIWWWWWRRRAWSSLCKMYHVGRGRGLDSGSWNLNSCWWWRRNQETLATAFNRSAQCRSSFLIQHLIRLSPRPEITI